MEDTSSVGHREVGGFFKKSDFPDLCFAPAMGISHVFLQEEWHCMIKKGLQKTFKSSS